MNLCQFSLRGSSSSSRLEETHTTYHNIINIYNKHALECPLTLTGVHYTQCQS
jgi:hypothetical protein